MSAPEIERRAAPLPREMAPPPVPPPQPTPPPAASLYREMVVACGGPCVPVVFQLSEPAQVDAAAVG